MGLQGSRPCFFPDYSILLPIATSPSADYEHPVRQADSHLAAKSFSREEAFAIGQIDVQRFQPLLVGVSSQPN
jgi:hypothetical protein